MAFCVVVLVELIISRYTKKRREYNVLLYPMDSFFVLYMYDV
jgi:hypothetical protein